MESFGRLVVRNCRVNLTDLSKPQLIDKGIMLRQPCPKKDKARCVPCFWKPF
nr:hypothetical protein [uncultured bacterium]